MIKHPWVKFPIQKKKAKTKTKESTEETTEIRKIVGDDGHTIQHQKILKNS